MADRPTDVFAGDDPDSDAAATKDFDALAKLLEDKDGEVEAAIPIARAEDFTVTGAQTADHRGRPARSRSFRPTKRSCREPQLLHQRNRPAAAHPRGMNRTRRREKTGVDTCRT